MKNKIRKILAIEVSGDDLFVLKALVGKAFPEIQILTASSGRIGLELCRREMPDVVLIDIVMPDMHGYVVCQTLKTDEFLKNIPVMMITASEANRASRIKALEVGADGFISKPLDESELTAQIRAMLRLREAEDRRHNEKLHLEELVHQRTRALEKELKQRKKAEESTQRAEKYYRSLIEKAPDGIVLIGTDGRIHYASPSARKIFGYQDHDLSFPDPVELTYPDDLPMVLATMSEITLNPMQVSTIEYRFKKKDGSWIWVESTISNQLAEPWIESIVINFRDITHRKKIEEAQQFLLNAGSTKSEEVFFRSMVRYLAQTLAMSFVCIDRYLPESEEAQPLATYLDGDFVENGAYQLKDTPCGTAFGNPTCIYKSGIANLFPEDTVLQDLGAECYVGATLWSSDGKPIGLIVLMDRNPLENSAMVESVLNHVSLRVAGELERQDTEDALLQSRKAFQNYFENCSVGMSVTSPTKNWIEVNQSLCQMLGYLKEELINMTWEDLTFAEDIEPNLRLFNNLVARKLDRYEMDKRFIRKDGSLLYTTLSTVCERNPDGSVHHLLSSYVDVTARKMAEDVIRIERSLLRTLIDNLPDSIYVKDAQSRKIVANKADLQHMGFTAESEIIGKTDLELFHSDNGVLGYGEDLSVIRTGVPIINHETSFIDSHRKRHWRLTSKFPFYDENCKVQGLVGIGSDITERKQIEDALRSSEELYRNLVEKMPDGVYKSTADGRIISANPAMVSLLGYNNVEELLQVDLHRDLHFKGSRNIGLPADKMEGGIGIYQLRRKDNSEIWVEDHGWHITAENGTVLYYEGIIRDITGRKRAEDKLRILSQAVEQNPASTIITDSSGKIEFVNAAFTALTQYTLEEVIHRSPRIFNRGHISVADFDLMWENLLSGKVWKGEYNNRRKDGNSYWEDVTISSLMIDKGQITNYILIMEDISDKKKMFDDLVSAKETAEESNRLKSAFLALMNHELRTPLNHILGFSELIMSNVSPDDNLSFASSIQTSGQSLLSIIEGVFDMALVEQSNIQLRKQTFSLMDHFMENKASFDNILRTSTKHDQIQLIFRPDTRWLSSYVTADRSKINQVLTNLFKNAVKFTHKGTIEFGYKIEEESKLLFYVKDTGIGIPEEKQNLIFDFFRQGDDSYTKVYGGIGIGLAISKKITKILQGEIQVISEPGLGSTFTLSIPVELSETRNDV